MIEPIQYHNQEELNKFRENGVIIPEPRSLKIERSINLPQIGKGTLLHPFSRIEGEQSFIDESCEIGIAGAVTILNSGVGKGSRLGTLGPVSSKILSQDQTRFSVAGLLKKAFS